MTLPAKVMTPGEAATYLQPYLMDGETYFADGLAQSMDIAKNMGIQGAGEGRLFVTNARIIHWVEETEKPWLYLAFSDIVWVEQTDRDVPWFARKNGMTQLLLHTLLPQGRFQFLANARLSRQLASDFPQTQASKASGTASSAPTAGPSETPSQRQARAEASSPQPAPGQQRPKSLSLPVLGQHERIPAKVASLAHVRVIDASTFAQRLVYVAQVQDAVDNTLGTPAHDQLVEQVSEAVVGEYRKHVQGGALPGFDPQLLMTAVALGVAVALVERDAGWTQTNTIHPVIHTTLAMMGLSLGEDQGPGPGLVLDASFNQARGSKFSQGVFDIG
jgi:hypothetical protein